MLQWLGLCASTAGGEGSIPSQGTKILYASLYRETKISPQNRTTLGKFKEEFLFLNVVSTLKAENPCNFEVKVFMIIY